MKIFIKCFIVAILLNIASTSLGVELIIKYKEFEGRPVEFVYDYKDNRIALRILMPKNAPFIAEKENAFLKQEIDQLTLKIGKTKLGNGYTFVFEGGYPEYAFYREVHGMIREWACLLFAEKASINIKNKEIHVWGAAIKPRYYRSQQ